MFFLKNIPYLRNVFYDKLFDLKNVILKVKKYLL